jgi:hypothetical protein
MGEYRPLHKSKTITYQKRRRNNRILEKFYDAKYVDIRDDSVKSGQELSCNRTNRSESRNSSKNERVYRGVKKSKGHRSIRRRRYELRPGDIILYYNNKYRVIGVQNHGDYTKLEGVSKVVRTSLLLPIRHICGWERAS